MVLRYSTGCVDLYTSNGCSGSDLSLNAKQGANFRFWYELAGGFQLFSRWTNLDVWGSDFRDASSGDLEPNGGSDVPEIYFFSGHGTCQNPPTATSPDFIRTCGTVKPDSATVGTQCRWGNGSGRLRFAFIDASCPMDLVSLVNSWFPVFQGLHIATGHSGTSTQDTLDSADRGSQFAANTVGFLWLIPTRSVGDAWMKTGFIDIQDGCCAVVLAAGRDRADAIDRRDNERLKDNRSDPIPNWFAWRWICN